MPATPSSWIKRALLAGLLCLPLLLPAQDIHLSQFYETPLLRNPALAGIFTGNIRIQAVYRNQWNGANVPYQTGALSGELKFPVGQQEDYITGALQLTYDVAGTSHFQTTQVLPAINYHKSLSASRSMYLSLAFMGGFTQRQFNPEKMSFDNQYNNGAYDPSSPSGETFSKYGYTYPDMGAGLSFNSTFRQQINYFIGAAWYHFNRPEVSFYGNKAIELQPKWEYNAGLSGPLSERVRIIAQYNQLRQGDYSEIIGGALIGYDISAVEQEEGGMGKIIYGGLFVRLHDALIPVVKIELNNYEIGFSYDINTAQGKAAAAGDMGGFELSLSYRGFFANSNSVLHALRCPRF
ncbi:PorP/SprF family type IX secretion system membrane protein [Compostibacter hankyongensis]|uniref:Type IX secretion system membrane protein PorP/SprF n=1 Tax=Compostibacter hankyongensis TaxID=1007089 RepID=A0ABP8FYB2_9BACT